jgi:pimeloyl-ACP methyl ester carboxylesterase
MSVAGCAAEMLCSLRSLPVLTQGRLGRGDIALTSHVRLQSYRLKDIAAVAHNSAVVWRVVASELAVADWRRRMSTYSISKGSRHMALGVFVAIFAAIQLPAAIAQETTTLAQNGEARLRVFSEGHGPAIVLLPGGGRGPRDFEVLTKHIVAAGFRVIRPEPRGFGESVGPVEGVTLRDLAADVAAAIETTGSSPAVVVGYAYGNRVARMLATERPNLVRGVVLIAAGGKFPPKPEVLASLRSYQDKSLPLEKRAEIARAILYGPKSNLSIADMRIEEQSAATIKAQSSSFPLAAWWVGGTGPMLILQGLHDVIAISCSV